MKPASIATLKKELIHLPNDRLIEIILKVGKFKKENKEMLSYLLFDQEDEEAYQQGIKAYIDEQFELINKENYYFIKKSIRKILRNTKRYIKYSKNIETETSVLIHFCNKLYKLEPSYRGNNVLINLHQRQIQLINKNIANMHEDLRYDFQQELIQFND